MRILVVGMADSVHLSRWLSQFHGSNHVFRVVSSSPHRRIHSQLNLLFSSDRYSISRISKFLSLPMWLADRFLSDWIRGLLIAFEARRFKPDLVHVLEFQNGGYAYLRARAVSSTLKKTPLLLTPYGSDIYWYQNYPSHLARIRKLLTSAAAISSECRRDEVLATKYGFEGRFMPRVPAFGAIEIHEPASGRCNRKQIAVKGYQNTWGQAILALKALEIASSRLNGHEVVLYSCNKATIKAARGFAARTGLKVTVHPKGALSNQEVLEIFQSSALYIGLSTSDGISASMIEAMANGAIPIQSDTSCCDEWLADEVGGYLVRFDDVEKVAELVARIIEDESWQRQAAQKNFETLKDKLDPEKTKQAAFQTYELLSI